MKNLKILPWLIFLMTGLIFENSNAQQQFILSNGVFSNGVANATNSSFQTWATSGQTFIGELSNSNYTSSVGFWYTVYDIPTGVVEEQEKLPKNFRLHQNYPNPFNPVTTISFALPKTSDVKLVIYDVLGKRVKKLIDHKLEAGQHTVLFDGADLPSGIYIYKMVASDFSAIKKFTLIK